MTTPWFPHGSPGYILNQEIVQSEWNFKYGHCILHYLNQEWGMGGSNGPAQGHMCVHTAETPSNHDERQRRLFEGDLQPQVQ